MLGGGPETTAIGGEELIDQKELLLRIEAELKLGIGQDDSDFCSMFSCRLIQGEAPIPSLEKKIFSQLFFRFGVGHRKIVSRLGLRCGGENRLGQRIGFTKAFGKRSAPRGTFLLIFLPSTACEVTADDTLDRQGLGGEATGQPACIFFRGRNARRDLEAKNMMRMGIRESFEPELRDGGEEDSLSRDGIREDHVVGGDTVGRDKPDFIFPAVDISNFPRS